MSRVLKPQIQAPPPPPPPPSPTSPDEKVSKETNAAMDAAAEAERRARGRASTLLTGSDGVSESGTSVSRRMLLGS